MSAHPHFLWTDLFRPGKSRKIYNITQILHKNILFMTLTRHELHYIASMVYERVYQPEEVIFNQDDRGLGLYIIAAGRIAIKSEAPKEQFEVTILEKGSFFGEIALVEPHNRRSASATALERSTLLGFFKPDLITVMERQPLIGAKILFQLSTVLGQRLIETTGKLIQATASSANSGSAAPSAKAKSKPYVESA